MPISLIISYVFNYVLFCCTSFCILCVCFYCTSLAAAVSALCALLSSHTYLCPCNCLYLFYDKINDTDDDDDGSNSVGWLCWNCRLVGATLPSYRVSARDRRHQTSDILSCQLLQSTDPDDKTSRLTDVSSTASLRRQRRREYTAV